MEALAQNAALLGIDHSFYYLFVLMFVLYALLRVVYLAPYQRLLQQRKAKTEGARKEAEELKARAEQTHENYKARLKELNAKARNAARESEDHAKKEEAKILTEATNKAKEALQNTQKELEAQRRAVLEALSAEIAGIAGEIATKAMGRS